jgi:RNA polymerase sigma-70 factor, ECF subfamily
VKEKYIICVLIRKMANLNDCREKSDAELVELTLKDQEFFVCIIKRYEQKLLRYIYRITNVCKEDAEDLLQEIFIKVYKNLNGYDLKLKFSSWIYRIAHNQIIDNFRKSKARPDVIDVEVNDDLINNLKSDFDLNEEIDNKFLNSEMKGIFVKMDKKYREVLVLKYLEDKDYNEISDILKKPKGTVATLLNRAKKQFKKVYNKKD